MCSLPSWAQPKPLSKLGNIRNDDLSREKLVIGHGYRVVHIRAIPNGTKFIKLNGTRCHYVLFALLFKGNSLEINFS